MNTLRIQLIETPPRAGHPNLVLEGVSESLHAAIQQSRPRLLEAVHAEVQAYISDPQLCWPGGFPDSTRLSGRYYIARESYILHKDPDWVQIGVMCHCLERPNDIVPREDDYLGLEVWLKCRPDAWDDFEVFRNTDSSSI